MADETPLRGNTEGSQLPSGNVHPTTEKQEIRELIQREIKRIRTYTPKIGVFGVTGVGKSSLCNALFGRDVAEVSDVAACTRNPQELLVTDDEGGGLILVDVPGVGESEERDKEYLELYRRLVPELDLVLWAIKADDRAYASGVRAYQSAVKPHMDKCPVIFVITHADKIEPFREWDEARGEPGDRQKQNLEVKKQQVLKGFDLTENHIVPVSAHENYNIAYLVSTIISALPNDKKSSFAREAKDENVTEEAKIEAEKGIFDYLAEMIGEGVKYAKEYLLDAVTETATRYGSKISKAVSSWLSKKFP